MIYYDTIIDWTLLKTENKILCEGECATAQLAKNGNMCNVHFIKNVWRSDM